MTDSGCDIIIKSCYNTISLHYIFSTTLKKIDTYFNDNFNNNSKQHLRVNVTADTQQYNQLQKFFFLHGYTIARNLDELQNTLEKSIKIIQILTDACKIQLDNSFEHIFDNTGSSAHVFPNICFKFEANLDKVLVTLKPPAHTIDEDHDALMNIVHNVNNHFKKVDNFDHVFRVRVLTNVDAQPKLFQLYGYTFACNFEDLERNLTEQISLALEVDISKFKIKLSETVKAKFKSSGVPIFKTINLENFVGIEPINNVTIPKFNRNIKNWLATNDKIFEIAVCNLLKQTEIHSVFGVIYSDVVSLNQLNYCVARDYFDVISWLENNNKQMQIDRTELESQLNSYFKIPGALVIIHKTWIIKNLIN